MAAPGRGTLIDSFILRLVPADDPDAGVDTQISVSTITVRPLGSGSQGQNVAIEFVYITGDPPSDRFSVAWSADQSVTLPTSWTFTPLRPVQGGDPNQVRTATLLAFVPNPTVTTTYTARITIHQE